MSDAEKKEKGDRSTSQPIEKPSLQSSDAQQSRTASANELKIAREANPNTSDGSLRHYQAIPSTAAERAQRIAEQDKSLELIDYSGPGKEVIVASRTLSRDTSLASTNPNDHEQRAKSESASTNSSINPLFEPVLKLRQYAESLTPGEERERLLKLAEEQNAELTKLPFNQQLASSERLQVKVIENQIDTPGPLSNNVDGWLAAGKQISALPFEQQLNVIGSALVAGLQQYQHEQNERSWGQLIGTIEGLANVSVNLAKIVDFGGAILLNNEKVASTIGEEFGNSLGQTVVAGIRLFEASDKYLFNIGYTGDYAKPFRDVATVGNALNEHWNELPPREQERLKYKLITELTADAIIGGGSAQAIGKAKKLTEILDIVAEQTGKSASKTLEISKKAVQSIAETVNQTLGPEYATAGGGKLRGLVLPADEAIDMFNMERRVYISKLDSTHRLRPIEAARERAQLNGEVFNETDWKKLTPKQKADNLTENGYEMLENPEPRPLVDSTKLKEAFRGDRELYSPVDLAGTPKSHLDSSGNLVPANVEGKFQGREVTVDEHILPSSTDPGVKGCSPFTSVGTNGVLWKYGDGKGIAVDVKALRDAILSGQVKDVEIIEHLDLIKMVEASGQSNFEKKLALSFLKYDNEFLIKGTVPARFLRLIGDQ